MRYCESIRWSLQALEVIISIAAIHHNASGRSLPRLGSTCTKCHKEQARERHGSPRLPVLIYTIYTNVNLCKKDAEAAIQVRDTASLALLGGLSTGVTDLVDRHTGAAHSNTSV